MSTVSGWLDCSWAVRPRGDCEWDTVVVVIPPQLAGRSPTLLREGPQTSSQSGLWPTIFAWAAPFAVAMTRFAILSFYLHSITLAPHHIRVVWSHGCGWPRARGLSPLIQACSTGGTRPWSCNTQRRSMLCHHTKGMCCFLLVQQLMIMLIIE